MIAWRCRVINLVLLKILAVGGLLSSTSGVLCEDDFLAVWGQPSGAKAWPEGGSALAGGMLILIAFSKSILNFFLRPIQGQRLLAHFDTCSPFLLQNWKLPAVHDSQGTCFSHACP